MLTSRLFGFSRSIAAVFDVTSISPTKNLLVSHNHLIAIGMSYIRYFDSKSFLFDHNSDYMFAVKIMFKFEFENNKLFTTQKYKVRLNIAGKNSIENTSDVFYVWELEI